MTQLRTWVVVGLSLLVQLGTAKANSTYGSECIGNMKVIDGAVQQWALETKKVATDTYALTDTTLLAFLTNSKLPSCKAGGEYVPGRKVTDAPVCSYHGTIEQASERELRPIRDRTRQLNIAACLIVLAAGILMSPVPLLNPHCRRLLTLAMPLVLVALFLVFGQLVGSGLIVHFRFQPLAILSGFGVLLSLLLVVREQGLARIYGQGMGLIFLTSVIGYWRR